MAISLGCNPNGPIYIQLLAPLLYSPKHNKYISNATVNIYIGITYFLYFFVEKNMVNTDAKRLIINIKVGKRYD